MVKTTGVCWGGRLALALLMLGWVVTAVPARGDEPAKELTDEQREKLEKEAAELGVKAGRLYQDGQYAAATEVQEKVLACQRKLYPVDKYPGGHPDLADSLNALGFVLKARGEYAKAEPYYRDALEMKKRLYPPEKYPDGLSEVAYSLNELGLLLGLRGEYGKAEPFLRDALEMKKRLYPAEKYPDGHPDLAVSLNNLGFLLHAQGEYGKAEPYYREALAMRQRLYPAEKYPDGHRDATTSLNNLGGLLWSRGEYGQAEPFLRAARDMLKRLYPVEKFPDGHPDLAMSLSNLGVLLKAQGEYGQAGPYYRDALEMRKRLYPPDKYPDGHPDLATSLGNMGELLRARGEYGQAEPYCHAALDMRKLLYPAEKYPDGHPDLAGSLNNLGGLLVARGEYGQAADAFAEGAAMYDRLAAAFADLGAEAETLNLYASLPGTRNGFLAATARVEGADPAAQYPVLWRGKSALARALTRRRRLLRAAVAADGDARKDFQKLMGVRQELARLILAPARPGDDDRAQLLRDLSEQKERLEKKLAALLPASDRETPPYTDLADRLPEHAAFVDLYRYADWDFKAVKWGDAHYAAFVLQKGRPVHRVELAAGAAIEKDLTEWRDDVTKGLRGDAASRLRSSVWGPIAKVLGDDVQTVYVCPDGALSALPWAALPGAADGHVLLEDYTFAVVPSGPFLLEQLSRPADKDGAAGVLLAVGGVRYDRDGAPADKTGRPWPALPATDRERAGVVAAAGKLPKPPAVVELSGADADVAQLVKDLPAARWAHLATHGFFAAPKSEEREHLFRPDDFLMGAKGERCGAAERNPLTLSGLVLAGANQPADGDGGVLTGEVIAGLDLDNMDLAVLSACQTGLGEAATGEGVFGLQRAFHSAGTKNVVASLWKVDDEAAAALMNLFYYHLWEKGEPPLEALHHAQLELYRNPQGVPALARGRGAVRWDEAVAAVTKPPADPKEAPRRPAAVKDWAAFVLSGAGR